MPSGTVMWRPRRMSDEDGYDSPAWMQLDWLQRVGVRQPGPEPSHDHKG
jgi:hypothetical protein